MKDVSERLRQLPRVDDLLNHPALEALKRTLLHQAFTGQL